MFSEEIVGKENQWKSELRERNQELCSILEQEKKWDNCVLMVVDDTDYIVILRDLLTSGFRINLA